VASLSQGRTAAAQCGLFTHKSVPVIFEPPCINLSTKWILVASFKLRQIYSWKYPPVLYEIRQVRILLTYSLHAAQSFLRS